MKTLLVAINAKYIHTNLAIRLLKTNTSIPVDIHEFTIKDDADTIIDGILSYQPDLIGFSCYIWNIELVKAILVKLKTSAPKVLIVLGGPEVSYCADDYITAYAVDFVVKGEGEIAFDQLLHALTDNLPISQILNLSTSSINNPIVPIKNLRQLQSPHILDNNFSHRITYIESSRGCPFACSYCMASLEKPVRFFFIDDVKRDLLLLMQKGAKVFKFLDRTFNTDVSRAKDLFAFIITHHFPETSFQFEITGDILSFELIEFIHKNAPKNLFRFEIGIQSTNDATNRLVYRHQDNALLFAAIKLMQAADVIDLHLDLIAGLPQENILSFAKTFDDVMALRPLECQLGFLKLLRGTKLFEESSRFGYRFMPSAPYEIMSNDVLSSDDLKSIHGVSKILDKFYNSHFMPKTMTYILDQLPSCFDFFNAFGSYFDQHFNWFAYNLDDLFTYLLQFLKTTTITDVDYIEFLMKYDYLSYYKIKPKLWWQKMDKVKRKESLMLLHQTILQNYTLHDLIKHALVEQYKNQYIIAIYMHNRHNVLIHSI